MTDTLLEQPDRQVSVNDVFGIDSGMLVPAYGQKTEHVPDGDPAFRLFATTNMVGGLKYGEWGLVWI